MLERLPYVVQEAEQDVPVVERCRIDVTWTGEEYRLSGGGQEDEYELSLAVAYETLFARLHDRAMANMPEHTRIHAASARGKGGLVLLVGDKLAGKSTLAAHLMLQGYDVLGDELVLLRHGAAVTFPRRFYLRFGSMVLLPALAEQSRHAPFVHAPGQGRLIATDPLVLGRPWRIEPAPVAAAIYLEPNHGGQSSLDRCGKVEMVRRVVAQSTPPLSGRRDWLADLCATVDHAETAILTIGNLASASAALRPILLAASDNKG